MKGFIAKKVIFILIGIVCLVAGLSIYLNNRYFTPRYDSDYSYSADVTSIDTLYNEETRSFDPPIKSTSTFKYEVIEERDGILEVNNIFEVKTPSGEKLFSVERLYGIDPFSGKHVEGYGDKDRSGYLFAPKNVKANDSFTYWHVNYDAALEMQFEGEEVIDGVRVFRYKSIFGVDQTSELSNLEGVPENRGVELDVVLRIWIEPTSGELIKYQDRADAYYYDIKTGERQNPWNSFSNEFTNVSTLYHAEQADLIRNNIIVVRYIVSVIFLVISLFAFYFSITVSSIKDEDDDLENKGVLIPYFGSLYVVPAITLFIGLFIVFAVVTLLKNNENVSSNIKVQDEINLIEASISNRANLYINALKSGTGLFNAKEDITRDEWKVFTEALSLEEDFPGIQGFGYSEFINKENKDSYEENLRAEGFEDFAIRPEGERNIYTSIVYLEPFDARNQEAFGFDMYSESNRMEAMDLARDNNEPQLSARVTLVQEIDEDIQAGFLIYVPVYSSDNISTLEEKRENIKGYVYAPFRADNFMNALIPNRDSIIDFAIFDKNLGEPSEETLIFDSSEFERNIDTIQSSESAFTKDITIANYDWEIIYTKNARFDLENDSDTLILVTVVSGTALSIGATIIVYMLAFTRINALKVVAKKSRQLKLQAERSRTIAEEKTKLAAELNSINKSLKDKESTSTEDLENIKKINSELLERNADLELNLKALKEVAE